MNRLKTLPWTQLLLLLILLANIANWIEIRRVREEAIQIDRDVVNGSVMTDDDLNDVRQNIENSNEHLKEMEVSLHCLENRFAQDCIAAGHFRINANLP